MTDRQWAAMGRRYDKIVVAKLPFVPLSWFTTISHRNIAGTDLTDCSYIFF